MATLPADKLATATRAARQHLRTVSESFSASQSVVSDALQAVEDWFEGERTAINSAIDTATSPVTLSVSAKKYLVASYLIYKAQKELE